MTLGNPVDCSPPCSSVHGDSPGKNSGVGCHALLQEIFPTQWIKPRSPTLQVASLLSEPPSPVVSIFLPFPNYHVRTDSSKVPDAGKDWGQKEKRALEDEMPGWHHWCNGHELGQILGDSEGQRGLACCSPWSNKESNVAGWLNNKIVM